MSNAKILSTEEVLALPVTAFPFSERALTILKKQGVMTMQELVDTDAKAWLFSFICDKKTLGEVVAFLQMMGFTMKNADKAFTSEAIETHAVSIYESWA